MSNEKCPCGMYSSPQASCDRCDGWTTDSNTGWGGFRDHYLRKNFNNEKERKEYEKYLENHPDEENEEKYY